MDDRFEAFSTSHYLVLALFAAGTPVLLRQGHRVRGTLAEERSRRTFSLAIIATALPLQVLQLLPGAWSTETSLPLHLCDLAWVATAYALWTRRPWACALTCYWGLTLTSQALLTPSVSEPFPQPMFIGYWTMHVLVVWAAIYLTGGLHFRPTWRLYGSTLGLTIVWMVCVMTVNVALGTDYGYLNGKPGSDSVLDLLGPWPWYVVSEVALVSAAWAAMTLPWAAAERRSAAGEETVASPALS